jgi:hypothetical protein
MNKPHADIKAVFDVALEIASPTERNAYLDKVCADVPQLRQKVEALLQAYEAAGSFLESPAGRATAAFGLVPVPPSSPEQPGTIVANR